MASVRKTVLLALVLSLVFGQLLPSAYGEPDADGGSPLVLETVTNLADNPGFELGDATTATSWLLSKVNTNSTIEPDATVQQEGARSIKMVIPSTADRALVQQKVAVTAGQSYMFRVQYRTEELAGKPMVALSWYNGSTYLSEERSTPDPSEQTWTEVEMEITAPANATHVLMVLHAFRTPGTIWYDNVSLIPLESYATIEPSNATFDKNPLQQSDLVIQLHRRQKALTAIADAARTLVSGTDYVLAGDEVTLLKSYMVTLDVGTHSLAFQFEGDLTRTLELSVIDSSVENGNLVLNPGFELGLSTPTNWVFNKVNTNSQLELDVEESHNGQRSAKLTVVSAADRAVATQSGIEVQGGSIYEFSLYYKTFELLGQPLFQLSWFKGSTYLSESRGYGEAKAEDWTQFAMKVQAPKDATSVTISLHNIYTPGVLWLDDVSLQRLILNAAISPSVAAFDQADPEDLAVTLVLNGNELDHISDGQKTLIEGADYTLAEQRVLLNTAYLSSLATGTTELTFVFSGGADQKLQLLVTDSSLLAAGEWTFDKNERKREPVTIAYDSAAGALTGLRLDGQSLSSTAYTAVGSAITLSESWLLAQDTGVYRLSLDFAGGGKASAILRIVNTATPLETNLLSNASFESGNDHPDSWQVVLDGAGSQWGWDHTQAYKDARSIRLQTATAEESVQLTHEIVPIVPQNSYQFEGFYRANSPDGEVEMTIEWLASSDPASLISGETIRGLRDASAWRKLFHEQIAPADARYVRLTLGMSGGPGEVWFDQAQLVNNNILRNVGFEEGTEAPDSWSFRNQAVEGSLTIEKSVVYRGEQAVKLAKSGALDTVGIVQDAIAIYGGKMYQSTIRYQTTSGTGTVNLTLNWFDAQGGLLRRDEASGAASADWTVLTTQKWAPELAVTLELQISLQGDLETAWLDEAELRQTLVDSARNLVPVTDLYDVNEQMAPDDFWGLMADIELEAPVGSVWTQAPLANFYFGPLESELRNYVSLRTPELTLQRDASVPVVSGLLGQPIQSGMPLAIAEDIEFRPFMSAHSGYSNKYFPRSMQNYVLGDYTPSYVLTGEDYFRERAEQLLDYMLFSQWQEDGSNAFVAKYYPNDYTLHPEWAGGWDDVFDWQWRDAYGYLWNLHEPDHHVNSSIASIMVNAYEQYGKEKYLEAARKFFHNQVPRYGFHKGVWNNHSYYWTEYNPSGASTGIAADDSTDNVSSLVMMAAAKLGYYETDPQLKKQYLEYARGLLWYLVRELALEGRWYYDGFENKINPDRFAVSHDGVVIQNAYMAMVYMYKAGVDMRPFWPYLSNVEEQYTKIWGLMQRKTYMKMAKIYDGEPEPNGTLTFSTFAHTTGYDLQEMRFQDRLPAGFVVPETLDVRISGIVAPDGDQANWTIDPERDVVLTVTPEQLEAGIIIPFAMPKRTTVKISYEAVAGPDFQREQAVDEHSEMSGWRVDEDNAATFVRLTSGTSGEQLQSHTMPLKMPSQVNSANFMSFSAQLLFPFTDEVASILEVSPAPAAQVYWHDAEWGQVAADKYVYPIQSLYPVKEPSGMTMYSDSYGDKGRVLAAKQIGDYVELAFESFLPQATYEVYAHYAKDNSRGIASMLVDGVPIGEPVDLFTGKYTAYDAPVVIDVAMGERELTAGKHTVRYVVEGKNAASSGYELGIYDGIVLVPTDVPLPALAVYGSGVRLGQQPTVFAVNAEGLRFTAQLQGGQWPNVEIAMWINDVPYTAGSKFVPGSGTDEHVLKVELSDGTGQRRTMLYPFTVRFEVPAQPENPSTGSSGESVIPGPPSGSEGGEDDVVPEGAAPTDVKGHWAEKAILEAVASGLARGYTDGTFRPDAPVTRAEFIVLLVRALKLNGGSGGKLPFTDREQIGKWAADAVAQALDDGIVHGYGDGSFRPGAAIGRAEMFVMLVRALKLPLDAEAGTAFADDAAIPGWAKASVSAAARDGLALGDGVNRFAPSKTATRAEAIVLLLRALALAKKA